jgi:hypothetical protein
MRHRRHNKIQKGKVGRKSTVKSDRTTQEQSPPYQEFYESSWNDDYDDVSDGYDTGGAMASLAAHQSHPGCRSMACQVWQNCPRAGTMRRLIVQPSLPSGLMIYLSRVHIFILEYIGMSLDMLG